MPSGERAEQPLSPVNWPRICFNPVAAFEKSPRLPQSDARRSISAESVISARVLTPVGEAQTRSSLFPNRNRCICCRPESGARPNVSITSEGNRRLDWGILRRMSQATTMNSPTTMVKLAVTLTMAPNVREPPPDFSKEESPGRGGSNNGLSALLAGKAAGSGS